MPRLVTHRTGLRRGRGEDGRARPADRHARYHASRASRWKPAGAVDYLRRTNGAVRGGVADGRPVAGPRHPPGRGDPRAVGHHQRRGRRRRAGRSSSSAPACALADLAEERAGERISFADTQVQPRAVITSPEWSGSETGGRRYSPFVVNVERKKPWHTLTGRMHFFLDHDWIAEYGEALPVYRPPLNYVRHFGDQGLRRAGPAGDHRPLPDAALEVVDPLGVPGQPAHAAAVPRRPGDLDEPAGRGEDRGRGQRLDRGVTTATASWPAAPWSRHRMPEGTVYMYHAKDRHLMTPKSEISGWHGGGDNSLTRLVIKPTHMIGGYAQLSYGFNYYGPTGNQRDEITVIRRRSQEVEFDAGMRVDGPDVDGDEPRQVHRLPHLHGHLQAGVDQPARHRVRLLQQRRDQARRRLSQALRGPGAVARAAGRWTARVGCSSRRAAGCASCCPSSTTRTCRRSTTTATRGPTTTRR